VSEARNLLKTFTGNLELQRAHRDLIQQRVSESASIPGR
jgi:hypothetical protein